VADTYIIIRHRYAARPFKLPCRLQQRVVSGGGGEDVDDTAVDDDDGYSLDDSDSDESRQYHQSSDGETDTDGNDNVETNLLFGGKEEEEGVLALSMERRAAGEDEEGMSYLHH